MSNVDKYINDLLAREGGYVNNPNDAGGETNFGITHTTARANGFQRPMRSMTRQEAFDIYKREYWQKPKFSLVEPVYPRVADELFDTGVNMGQGTAARFLQRALNVVQGTPLTVDGQIGSATLTALGAFKAQRGAQGEEILVRMLDALQGARYIELTEQRAKNRTFTFGWFAHRIENA